MKKITTKTKLFALLIMATVLLSACGGNATPEATPILSVDAVYTSAAATVEAALTEGFLAQPSATNTIEASATPQPSATLGIPPTQPLVINPPVNTSATGGCNNSMFISDVTIPDGTLINAGQVFVKTWRIKNTGTCPWTTDYKITFVSGEKMGADTTNLTSTVQPNQEFDVTISFTAPTGKSGDLRSTWQIATNNGQLFGTSFYVLVKLSPSSSTPGTGTPGTATKTNTPGPTSTPSMTNTPGPTMTPSSTNTPAATDTPSPTNTPETPTDTPTPTYTPSPTS